MDKNCPSCSSRDSYMYQGIVYS